jgi:hypothetical protein
LSLPYSYGRDAQGAQTLCDPRAKRKRSSGRPRTPSGGEGVCGRISRGVAWDAARKGTGVSIDLKLGTEPIEKNTLSVVDPGDARVENTTEGVVGPGTDTS